jgi:hypothetical protein
MNAPVQTPEFIYGAKERVEGLLKWRAYIEKALARNDCYLTYTEVCQKVLSGQMLWFQVPDSFVIAELLTAQRGTYCHITIAGGTYTGICRIEKEQLIPLLKVGGVSRISTLGRIGFTKRKLPDGWRTTKQQYFIKDI